MFKPFQDASLSLGNLQDEMGHLLERVWHAGLSTGPLDGQKWAPHLDLYEYADHYTLFAELPGVDRAGVELTFLNNVLTIRGEKNAPPEAQQSLRSLRKERRYGPFCRSVELPGDVDADRVNAEVDKGLLIVRLPKLASSKPREIKIGQPGSGS